MSKANLSIALIAAIIFIGLGYIFTKEKPLDGNADDTNSEVVTDSEGGFSMTAEYVGENSWEYKVEGELPTPCHSADVDSLVAESFPEQVSVKVTLTEPDDAIVCVQVIREFEYEGEFSASEGASVNLSVSEK